MNNENFNKRPACCLPTSDLVPLVLILARVASPESEYHTSHNTRSGAVADIIMNIYNWLPPSSLGGWVSVSVSVGGTGRGLFLGKGDSISLSSVCYCL